MKPHTLILALLLAALSATGCAKQSIDASGWLVRGDLGRARVHFHDTLTTNKNDRKYLLDRMRLAVITLADGYPGAAQPYFEKSYDLLRTQGINEDKTVQSVVLTDGARFWKGEPFEQALAMTYYGIQQGSLGRWDNARAAVGGSLFQLRDFGNNDTGQRINTYEIAQRAIDYERKAAGRSSPSSKETDYIDHGYVVRESNFTLAYILAGIANQQLQRPEEASDNFLAATQYNPALSPLTEELRSAKYNTVLVIGWGLGPRKNNYGPDGALTRFDPRTASDTRPLILSIDGQTRAYPIVTDVNSMAIDHMWNNLEDVRTAKSFLGNVLLTSGLIATGVGASANSNEAVYAGLGAAAMGLYLKATASADTTYCDAFPQRFYVIPLQLDTPNAVVTVQIEGVPGSRLALTGLVPPTDDGSARGARLRYVHLLGGGYYDAATAPPAWATSGQVFVDSDSGQITSPDPAPLAPYILGGNSVRQPSDSAILAYQRAGKITGVTPGELAEYYRAEGITWDTQGGAAWPGLHLLEGGNSITAPLGGTLGFVRLFGAPPPLYQPKSPQPRSP